MSSPNWSVVKYKINVSPPNRLVPPGFPVWIRIRASVGLWQCEYLSTLDSGDSKKGKMNGGSFARVTAINFFRTIIFSMNVKNNREANAKWGFSQFSKLYRAKAADLLLNLTRSSPKSPARFQICNQRTRGLFPLFLRSASLLSSPPQNPKKINPRSSSSLSLWIFSVLLSALHSTSMA